MQHKINNTLFGQYIKEYYNGEILEADYGFAIYYIKDNACMIDDLYIIPEKRRSKYAYDLVRSIETMAKECRCNYLEAEAFTDSSGFEYSVTNMAHYGFVKVTEDLERGCELWRKQLEYL